MVSGMSLRAKRLKARENSHQKLHICQGLLPGSPFHSHPRSAWHSQRHTALTSLKVVEEPQDDYIDDVINN